MAVTSLFASPDVTRPAQAAANGKRRLTRQQAKITILVACGLSDAEIARRLCIAENTTALHVKNAQSRLRVHSRAALVATAIVLAEISLEELFLVMWSTGQVALGQADADDRGAEDCG